jgi:hypothetical protein
MEQPPPVPPPPPDYRPAAAAVGNSSLYTVLAWALVPPLGSLVLMFMAGRDDLEAKFNAANATAVHTLMLAVYFVLWVLSQVLLPFLLLFYLWALIWFGAWVFGVFLAAKSEGHRFRFPVLTDTLAGLIATLEGLSR